MQYFFVWNLSHIMNISSALWLKMARCFCTRAVFATVLITYTGIYSHIWIMHNGDASSSTTSVNLYPFNDSSSVLFQGLYFIAIFKSNGWKIDQKSFDTSQSLSYPFMKYSNGKEENDKANTLFQWWLGAIRHQAVIWANVGTDLCI